jgi:hypothetical protein
MRPLSFCLKCKAEKVNELEATLKEWIKLRDEFKQGDNDVIFRIVEIEEKLKNQYHIANPIEWLLSEERKLR